MKEKRIENPNSDSDGEDNEEVKATNPVNICPKETPYSDGKSCFACTNGDSPLFNLETKQC